MGNLYIRMRTAGGKGQRWQLVSTGASGPPAGAPGLLKLRQDDGTWTQHLSPSAPNTDLVRLRTGKGWEPVMYMGQNPLPASMFQRWDWSNDFRNPHFQIIREFGEIDDWGALGRTATHVDRIRKLVGSFTPDEYPAAFTAYSLKKNWYLTGLAAGFHDFTGYAVGHTRVDLDLIKSQLPAGSRVAKVHIDIGIGLEAMCDGDWSDGISDRGTFPYHNYNAYLFDTTAQDNPSVDVQFNSSRYIQYDPWGAGYPTGLIPTKPGSALHGVGDAGFIVSGRHLGTFNFGTDTAWVNGGYGIGNYKAGTGWGTVVLDYNDFAEMDHVDFGVFVEEVPMGKGTADFYDADTGLPIDSVNYIQAFLQSLDVTVYEYQPPPPDDEPQPSPG